MWQKGGGYKNAVTGNWTRVEAMATLHSTTKLSQLVQLSPPAHLLINLFTHERSPPSFSLFILSLYSEIYSIISSIKSSPSAWTLFLMRFLPFILCLGWGFRHFGKELTNYIYLLFMLLGYSLPYFAYFPTAPTYAWIWVYFLYFGVHVLPIQKVDRYWFFRLSLTFHFDLLTSKN